jgi:hypothetical protein
MRRWIIGFLIVAASAVCFAQDATPPLATAHTDEPIRADDPRSIQAHAENKALVFDMLDRWNAHDIDGYMEGAWKSRDFLVVVDAEETRGWTENLASYHRGYPDPSMMGTVVCERLETQLITTEVALVVMRWTLYLKGGKVLGTSSMVTRHFEEGWKVVSDHTTTLEP